MSDLDSPIAVTFKLDGNAPWIVLRATDGGHLDSLISEVEDRAASIAATHKALVAAGQAAPVGAVAQAVQAVQQGAGGQVIPMQQHQQQPQRGYQAGGKAPQPPGPVPDCSHGPRKWVSANDGSWKGWFCVVPKGSPDKCKTIYDRS